MEEQDLRINTKYIGKTGNIFVLFHRFHPNIECFRRHDNNLHFGREFIEFKDGNRIIDLEIAAEK